MKLPNLIISGLCAALLVTLCGLSHAQDDLEKARYCGQCGMDRKAYGYSRMVVILAGGPEIGVCSLHCATVELKKNEGKPVSSLQVADRNSRMLLDAEKAFWTLGGSKKGVMTPTPKWAFATREAALDFIKEYGGQLRSWDEALKAAQDELEKK